MSIVLQFTTQGLYAQDSLEYTLMLIGDAGDFYKPGGLNNFKYAKREIRDPKKTAVTFLGDNIYPAGLASKDDSLNRKDGESKLSKQLDISNGLCASYVIPGNHDWNHWSAGGKQAALRSEKYIESYGDDLYQTPSKACSGPEINHLTDDIILMAIDSQWWLHKWKKEPNMHEGCTIKSREDFLLALKDSVAKYKDKQIVLGLHHPPFTKGPHGGRYKFIEHLFPLLMFKKNLFVPLPVLGSIAIGLRAAGASRQDINHPLNKKLMGGIQDAIASHDRVVVVSGHEHSLQHFYQNDKNFVVSGGGCKHTHLGKSKKLLFGKSCIGFAKIKFYNNSTYLEFFSGEFNEDGIPIYTGFLY
jgi:hypothetical protein